MAAASQPTPVRRLGIAVIGQGVASYDGPLFRNLRKHGTYFRQIKPDNGVELLLAGSKPGRKHILFRTDTGISMEGRQSITARYSAASLIRRWNPSAPHCSKTSRPKSQDRAWGRSSSAHIWHACLLRILGWKRRGDEVLDRFQVKLFTEGSGTQIFSTTFAQWAAREALRRAQPHTLFVRFAPRQRQKPMNELMAVSDSKPELDPMGSLIDADMGAYYHWINQERLPGSEQSSFLVWFEGHSHALVIAPSLPQGTESNSPLNLGELLSLAG